MTTVFISYSHHNLVIARKIHNAIRAIGLGCWRDEKWLQPGNDFAEEITRAIRQCDAFVLLLSPASNSSDYVCKEVAIAHYFRKPIIPVLLEKCDLADCLLPYVIRLHHWDLTQHNASEFAAQLVERFGPSKGATGVPPHVASQQLEIVNPEEQPFQTRAVHLVTNLEYLEFVQSSGVHGPHHWASSDPHFSEGQCDAPVTRVSWDEAMAYCDWAGGCLPGTNGESPTENDGTAIVDISEIGEWRDAGTEQHKQVRSPHTSRLITIVDRQARLHNVGFRCAPVRSLPLTNKVFIDSGPCQLGTDVTKFSQLASIYRLPLALSQPILRRQLRSYNVHSFVISATCVTNEEFYEFTRLAGRPWPPHWHARWFSRSNRPFPVRLASQPVVNVSAENAQAYCIWSRTRLPSWLEWERAASGPIRQPYPWGVDYSAARCNSMESGRGSLAAVDEYPLGSSPDGIHQLCGNVAEWVVGIEGQFEVRGGSYRIPCELWGLAYAFRQAEFGSHAPDVGFRVVID